MSDNGYRLPWMTDAQWEYACMLADVVGGFHHIAAPIKPLAHGITASPFSSGFSTFDSDQLTRLVFLAHDRAIRVEIRSSNPYRIKLCMWKRQREGDGMSRHPSLEQAISVHRQFFPDPDTLASSRMTTTFSGRATR